MASARLRRAAVGWGHERADDHRGDRQVRGRAGRLGASVHNTQPWRFTTDGGPHVSLHADADRRLAVADPDGREMMISCGAALFNVRLAREVPRLYPRELSCCPSRASRRWRPGCPGGGRRRRRVRTAACPADVLTRRTHRGAFDPVPLPPDTLAALRAAAAREEATLRLVADDGRRAGFAAAVQTAEHELRRDGERLREPPGGRPRPAARAATACL